jgi:hypothetical protein
MLKSCKKIAFALSMFGVVFYSASWAADTSYLGMSLPATFQAFSSTSPWNVPIPSNPTVDPHSTDMIAKLKSTAGTLTGNYTKWTMPIHVIDSKKAPKVKIKTTKQLSTEIDPNQDMTVENIPMPQKVWADPSSDGHMVLVDPAVRTAWEFSRFQKNSNGTYQASGVVIWNLDGPGWRQAFMGDLWWTYGAIASGLPIIGGLIRPEEINAGVIKHALLCGIPTILQTSISGTKYELCSAPAARTDGTGTDYKSIPMGALLQLDPTLNLDALGLSPATKIIAKAMQQYGMYVGISSSTFNIYFQNLGSTGGAWKTYNFFPDLSKIPVDKFRVISCNRAIK